MIKVIAMYPNKPNAQFDHSYYKNKHMPMVEARLGDACKSYSIDRGLSGGEPSSQPTYVAVSYIYSDSVDIFQAGMAAHAEEILADIKNYTNLSPIIQISEVIVD